MKVVLALAVLCGLILTCESACNVLACNLAEETCTAAKNLLACYNTEKAGPGCTASQTVAIDFAISALSDSLKACNGAEGITKASLPVMILSLVAVYFKLK